MTSSLSSLAQARSTIMNRSGLLVLLLAFASALVASADRALNQSYEIEHSNIGDLKTIILSNTARGEEVVIVTDFGGRVEELKLISGSTATVRDVLLTHNGSQAAIEENMWWKGMILLPYANRIGYGRYRFFNESYKLPTNENYTSGSRLNAMHGFMAGKKAENIKEFIQPYFSAAITATFTIQDEPGYPFKLLVEITYNLTLDHGLIVTVRATNQNGDGTPLPFYMGWHPYFKCTPYSSIVTLDRCPGWNHVMMDKNMNPTGITKETTAFDGSTPVGGRPGSPTQYDDEYKPMSGTAMCPQLVTTLEDTASNQTVVLWQDERFRFVQVFTGYTEEGSIAIEPMSGMADAYNNHDHLTILSDGETWEGSFGVYVE